MPLLNIGNTTYVAWPLLIASARASSIPPSKLSRAALRPPDLESDVTAGTKATSIIAMMLITTRSSTSVNPREQQRFAKGRGVGFGNVGGFIVNRLRRRHPASDKAEQRRYWGV